MARGLKSRSQRRKEEEEREDPVVSSEESEDEQEDHDIEDDAPPVINPYEILDLEKDATEDDVKKAYRKAALKHHPDKAPESDKAAANKKFQEIAFAYAVLSDPTRRTRYDRTGSTAESLDPDDDFDWLSFYRELYDDVVSEANIARIAADYKDSADERRDLLDAYTNAKGDLNKVYESVMLSDVLVDDERFLKIIREEIEKGNVESFPKFERENDASREKAKTAERKARAKFEKEQAKEKAGSKSDGKSAPSSSASKSKKSKSSGGNGDMGDLAAMIRSRQQTRGGASFLDALEAKYAPRARGKKRATPMEEDEPDEEAFQAAAARLEAGRKKRK